MKKPKVHILLVEDDPNLGMILEESLELQNYHVTRCEDGRTGHTEFLKGNYDLCLIDVMLPQKDGFTLAKDIRTVNHSIPILFLTAKSMKEDRIRGFKIGGDDYITKPFSMEELLLRIQAVLKRSGLGPSREMTNRFSIGDYTLNYEKRELVRKNKIRKLTHKETELLRLLCIYTHRILDRDLALNLIWGDNSIFNARSMDVYISKLRKYLKEDSRIEIMTVHRRGFRLNIQEGSE